MTLRGLQKRLFSILAIDGMDWEGFGLGMGRLGAFIRPCEIGLLGALGGMVGELYRGSASSNAQSLDNRNFSCARCNAKLFFA